MFYLCDNLMVFMHMCKPSGKRILVRSFKNKNKYSFKFYYQGETSGMIKHEVGARF